jgi:hypothetical protein
VGAKGAESGGKERQIRHPVHPDYDLLRFLRIIKQHSLAGKIRPVVGPYTLLQRLQDHTLFASSIHRIRSHLGWRSHCDRPACLRAETPLTGPPGVAIPRDRHISSKPADTGSTVLWQGCRPRDAKSRVLGLTTMPRLKAGEEARACQQIQSLAKSASALNTCRI